ncbi:MAG TPA: AraC family transcriptional regulator [Ruminiclostridium sp.]|nr:AraC family transcriptional regulator [Ruminiclostridium sp.]
MVKDSLKENRVHGDIMFPLVTYHMECDSKADILDCHWHDEFEFLLVTGGRAVFQIGTRYYNVSEGQAIVIPSGEIHAGFHYDNSHCNYSAVVFNLNFLSSSTYDVIQNKYISPLQKNLYMLPAYIKGESEWEKEIIYELNRIFAVAGTKRDAYEMLIKSSLYRIFSILLPNCDPKVPAGKREASSDKMENIKRALEYIHKNFDRKIRLNDLARLSNMSEGHFCRFFKKLVRKTPVEYINYYRVNRAAKLLQNEDAKVIEIAMDVGFDSFSYFISMFKRYMKCTPSQYRKSKSV